MKQIKSTIITAVLIAVLVSCTHSKESTTGKNADNTETTQQSLYGRKWYLTKIHEGNEVREVTQRKAFIRFDQEKGSAGGNGSCNSFGSTLKANGKTISLTDIFSTKMYCDAVQSIEDSFFKQLAKVTRYEIKGNTLSLFEKDNLVLELEGE